MSQALAEALASIDDPEVIGEILMGLDDQQPAPEPTPTSTPASLQELYERYLRRRRTRSPSTIAQYKRTIPHFTKYAASIDITYPAEITPNVIDGYIDNLFDQYSADATIYTYTKNVRAFLNWLIDRTSCTPALCRLLDKEALGLTPAVRDEAIPHEIAVHLIQQHRAKRRGTAQHALLELEYNAGPRNGGVHSLDLQDFVPEDNALLFRHRPDEGTRLKNGDSDDDTPGEGERDVLIKPQVVEALSQYIATERPDVTDDYGREPLFATPQGRASRSTLRRWVYEATSCRWHKEQSEHDCDGSCSPNISVCSGSYSPHAIRRGAIVQHLSNDLPHHKTSERFDVSVPVIKKHYDPRINQTRKQDRAEDVMNAWTDF